MLELSEEQLNNLNKDALVIIASSLQDQLRSMAQQLENANARLDDNNRQIELLTEQIRIMNQRHFGKKAESGLSDMEGQLTLFDSFNEVEGFQKKDLPEPTIEEVTISSYRRSKANEYSRAVTPQIRQAGNRLSGLAETACASLLA